LTAAKERWIIRYLARELPLKRFAFRSHAGAVIVFRLLVLLTWLPLYMRHQVPINGNVLREVYPNWSVTHSALRQGRLPLWNPNRDMGEPHWADPKTLAAYPLSWLFVGVSDFSKFLQGWIFVHTLLAVLAVVGVLLVVEQGGFSRPRTRVRLAALAVGPVAAAQGPAQRGL